MSVQDQRTAPPRSWGFGDPGELMIAAEAVFKEPVAEITAPGGARRASLRLHLRGGRTVIATRRATKQDSSRERTLLHQLQGAEGHIPRLLGQSRGYLFQDDAGRNRLSVALGCADAAMRQQYAINAIASLEVVRRRAATTELSRSARPIALDRAWIAKQITFPDRLARALEVEPTGTDLPALGASLCTAPRQLIKWDSRPGNATVSDCGKIVWFDWATYGLRGGVEDIAILMADEYWPISPSETIALASDVLDRRGPEARLLLIRFALCQVAQRLLAIFSQVQETGWQDAEDLMRYDLLGVSQALARRLALRGVELADMDPLCARSAHVFRAAAALAAHLGD